MLVRKMTKEDIPEVAAIEADNFSIPWSENAFLAAMESGENILVVAEQDNKISGYICMYVSFEEGEITNVAVDKSQRKNGLGTAMMEYIFDEAREQDIERIVLEVRVSNDSAIALYKKMEFEELGIRKSFYDLPKEDALIMEWTRK